MAQAGVAFRELLSHRPGEMPSDTQQRASNELPGRVAGSRLNWWQPGNPVSAIGQRVLVGVAVWSGYDLRLLDHLDTALADPAADVTVDVFDIDAVQSLTGFESYIPGLGQVGASPVAGLWQDGRLVRRAYGYEGRKLVAEALGLDLAELSAFPPLAAAS